VSALHVDKDVRVDEDQSVPRSQSFLRQAANSSPVLGSSESSGRLPTKPDRNKSPKVWIDEAGSSSTVTVTKAGPTGTSVGTETVIVWLG
jgi:hypothetical protein